MHNLFPDPINGKKLGYTKYNPTTQHVTHWSTKNLGPDEYVIKKGRTTGVTIGKLNKLQTVTIETEQYEMWEIDQIPGQGPFLSGGDSGSWAIDMEGN